MSLVFYGMLTAQQRPVSPSREPVWPLLISLRQQHDVMQHLCSEVSDGEWNTPQRASSSRANQPSATHAPSRNCAIEQNSCGVCTQGQRAKLLQLHSPWNIFCPSTHLLFFSLSLPPPPPPPFFFFFFFVLVTQECCE